MAKVIEHAGDAISAFYDKNYDAIMHQCNCQCVWGAGIAKQMKQMIPELYGVDLSSKQMRPENKLGRFSAYSFNAPDGEFPVAVNLYGQLNYGRNKRQTNYAALTTAVLDACAFLLDSADLTKTVKVCCPKIGCGLAGGDWNIVKEILEFAPARIEFHVYTL